MTRGDDPCDWEMVQSDLAFQLLGQKNLLDMMPRDGV